MRVYRKSMMKMVSYAYQAMGDDYDMEFFRILLEMGKVLEEMKGSKVEIKEVTEGEGKE